MIKSSSFHANVSDIRAVPLRDDIAVLRQILESYSMARAECFDRFTLSSDYLRAMKWVRDTLVSARPLDARVYSMMDLLFDATKLRTIYSQVDADALIKQRIEYVKKHLIRVIQTIPVLGSKKIKNNSKIFTFGYSHAVLQVLLHAKIEGKNYQIFTTQGCPTQSGEVFAQELASQGIKTTIGVDAAARQLIKEADIILLGCFGIDYHNKVYSQLGSEIVAQIAHTYKKPVYVACDSFAYYETFGVRLDEVQHKPFFKEQTSMHIRGVDQAHWLYEKIDSSFMTGVISELGILTPQQLEIAVKKERKQFN